MIYYRRYIGAYQKRTTRLSMRDHGAYTLMLDFYYAEEEPLPLDVDEIYDICKVRTPDDRKSVDKVLRIHFEKRGDGYHNDRADREIAVSEQARTNGKGGGRPPQDKTKGGTGKQTGTVTDDGTELETGRETGTDTGTVTGTGTGKGGGSGHPSTFNHSAVQPSTVQPSTDSPAANPTANPPPSRAVAIALLIRNLEKERGKAPKITSIDPRVQAWAAAGITDNELREAHALAVADREVNNEDQAINAGFLDLFVTRVRTPGNGTSRLNGSAKPPLDWWLTPDGIFAKADTEKVPIRMRCIPGEEERGPIIRDHLVTLAMLCVKLGPGNWVDERNPTLMRTIEEIRQQQTAGSESS